MPFAIKDAKPTTPVITLALEYDEDGDPKVTFTSSENDNSPETLLWIGTAGTIFIENPLDWPHKDIDGRTAVSNVIIDTLRYELREVKTDLTTSNGRLKDAMDEVSALKRTNASLENSVADLRNELEDASYTERSVLEVSSDLSSAQDRIADLEAANVRLHAELDNLKETF